MLRAAATCIGGLGVTVGSTFASALGLSIAEQRIGFAVGVVMMVAAAVLFVVDVRRRVSVRLPMARRAALRPIASPMTERGEDLMQQIDLQRVSVEANGAHAAAGIVLDRLTGDVRAWSSEAGIVDEPPVAASFPPTTADYRRLGEFVGQQLARL